MLINLKLLLVFFYEESMQKESYSFKELPKPLENNILLALEAWLLQGRITPYVEYHPDYLQNIRSKVSYRKACIRRGFLTNFYSPHRLLDRLIWYPKDKKFRYSAAQDWNEEYLELLSLFTSTYQRTKYNY